MSIFDTIEKSEEELVDMIPVTFDDLLHTYNWKFEPPFLLSKVYAMGSTGEESVQTKFVINWTESRGLRGSMAYAEVHRPNSVQSKQLFYGAWEIKTLGDIKQWITTVLKQNNLLKEGAYVCF